MSGVSLSDLLGVGIALAAGLLIGLERGWHQRDLPDGHRVAGLRTFALIGLLGGLSGLLAQRWGAIVLVAVLAVVALLILAGYIVTARMHSVMGLTTAMAAITTFLVGVLAAGGSTLLASAVAVVTVALLQLKRPMHSGIGKLTEGELTSGIQLLLISVVILPVLPDRGFGPFEALNPYKLWWAVVLLALLSFLGFGKPKLRIPDIYENEDNQRAFGRLLHACDCCDTAEAVIDAIRQLDARQIKGLGPAVANLLYFIHPTLVVPFNTAIVRGYNALTGGNVKLGRWDHYLSMREGVMRLNAEHRSRLSNDLGAVAGLLFDIGSGRYEAPPRENDPLAAQAWQGDLARVREETAAQHRQWTLERESDTTHTEIQGWLRDLGLSLGFQVWIAANDRSREYLDGRLGDGCLEGLPAGLDGAAESVRLIDVVWLDTVGERVVAAFEVEHSTSIYSGIVRMLDLALGSALGAGTAMFLVAPDDRRDQVAQQLRRPAFSRVSELGIRYLPYGELRLHRAAIGRFGTGLKPILEVSQAL